MAQVLLKVDGEVENPLTLSFDELAALPEADQVIDVSRFHPSRQGDGVTLEAILALARERPSATYLTLHATADNFHASVPLQAVRGEGILVYRLGGGPLPARNGGPYRFLIKDPAACRTNELDDCANVKFVDRIELTAGKGQDTRPANEEDHARLHGASHP